MSSIHHSVSYAIEQTLPRPDDRAFILHDVFYVIEAENGFVGTEFESLAFLNVANAYVIETDKMPGQAHVSHHGAVAIVGVPRTRPTIQRHSAFIIDQETP